MSSMQTSGTSRPRCNELLQASPGSSTAQMQGLIHKILKAASISSIYTAGKRRKREEQSKILLEMSRVLESDATIVHSSFSWDLESAMAVVQATLDTITHVADDASEDGNSDVEEMLHSQDDNQQLVFAAWKVLHTSVVEWWAFDDPLLYAVLIQDWGLVDNEDSRTPASGLDFLEYHSRQSKSSNRSLDSQSVAAVCLATAWRTMERFQVGIDSSSSLSRNMSITGDRVWWISLENGEKYWEPLLSWALTMWMNPSIPESNYANKPKGVLVDRESGQTAAAAILIHFLQFGCDGWLYDFTNVENTSKNIESKRQASSEQFATNLLDQAERLSDLSMPFSSFAKLAMASLHLMVVLEQKQSVSLSPGINARLKRLTQNPNLWEHLWYQVCKVDAGTDVGESASWIIPMIRRQTMSDSLDSLVVSQEDLFQSSSLKNLWCRALSEGRNSRDDSIVGRLHWIWNSAPHLSRKTLEEMLPAASGISDERNGEVETLELLDYLLHGIEGNDLSATVQYHYAALLHSIFRDSKSCHDDLSRFVWGEMNDNRTLRLVESLTRAAQKNDALFKPFLLCLLDSVKLLVSQSLTVANLILGSADRVETIITLMQSTEGRMNTAAMNLDDTNLSQSSAESNRSTPTAHNLSRIDADLSVIEVRLGKPHRGFNAFLPLTAALVLASTVARTAAAHQSLSEESADLLLRRRIQNATSSFISEELCVGLENEVCSIAEATAEWTKRRTQLLSACIQDPTNESDDMIVSLLHAREIRRVKDSTIQKKRIRGLEYQLQESKERERRLKHNNEKLAHQMEMKESNFVKEKGMLQHRAQTELKHLSDAQVVQTKKAEIRLREASIQIKEMQSRAQEAEKAALKHADSLEAERKKTEELRKEFESCKLDSEAKDQQILSAKNSLNNMKEKEKKMYDHLRAKEKDLQSMECSKDDLHHSLESLFADMVSLSLAFANKEKEVSSNRKTVDSTIMKLKKELELERKKNGQLQTRQRQIDYDNEVLSKKLARTREKLENERAAKSLDDERKKRSQPVSYINHLHGSSHSRGKENSFGSGNQRRSKHSRR